MAVKHPVRFPSTLFMKRTAFVGILLAGACAFGTPQEEIRRGCDSGWKQAEVQYSPPILANGDIGLLIDYRNCQFQTVPSYRKIKCVGGNYVPSIYRAGRRTDDKALACFGRVEERVMLAANDNATPEKWRQELDIGRACSETVNEYAGGRTRIASTAFVHADRPVIAVQKRFGGDAPRAYVFEYIFAKAKTEGELPLHARLALKGADAEIKVEKAKGSISGAVSVVCDAPSARVENGQNRIRITVDNPQGEVAFFVIITDDFEKNDYKRQLGLLKAEIAKEGWKGMSESHARTWRKFWGETYVSIPDKRIEGAYNTALYNLKCWSTQWSIPVGILPSHWEGKYFGFTFFNPALCVSGHMEEALKVARFWRNTLEFAKSRAGKAKAGDESSGARYAWQSLENGDEGTVMAGRWLDHVLHMGNIALESYTYYRYTSDKKYLEEVSYPVLKECATFYARQMVYDLKDGRTVIGKCCDLERLPPALENAFLTTASAIATFNYAAEAADLIGVDMEEARTWREIAARLRQHLPRDGEKYLPYPNSKERSVGALAGIFPYGSVSADDTFQRAAVYDFEKNGLATGNMYRVGKNICSWYAAWLAGAQARCGDGEGAGRNLRSATDSVGKFGEIFEINEPGIMSVPWCSSPQGTYVQALNEMLLQCDGDTIKIAPAVPREWRDFNFKLRAYDDIEVEASFADGKLKSATFRAARRTSGREKTLVFPGGGRKKMKCSPNSEQTVSSPK